ncbi:class I SAM-dependent methyltransferase [Bailinhaonella thermotolerans]|uniref:Class I SAM-dependent methyltransferase n=1 Tax=Bailinhaonella thermotolerans TaxID=1070861 RepID=A0A3A4B8Q3_9ACTN|nr:class I SAM-dependent methyltransferase [Bailinhaonella thermotolerans]RJL34064.1 class I SAM-dependent methyltransferase [Bailinhaonella thermotolerans]
MPGDTAYHDALGDRFAAHAETSPYNAFTDRPAMLALAGDVAGARVLDVGCGAGHYAAELLARGAEVTGVDGSAALLRHARARVGGRAALRLHDLEEPLDFAEDAAFDGAVCALVYHHVTRRARLLAELRRVLRPGGWLLVSTSHPAADWRHFGGSYYSEDWVELPLGGGPHAIRLRRMPLETFLGELLDAGFVLERLVEPRPVAALREVDPAAYDKLTRFPAFLAVRLRRP